MDNIKQLKEGFDVKEYLEARDITIHEYGKNVNRGWVGIACLFCPDDSNHLGIRLKDNFFSCFKCKESGNPIDLIREIDSVNYNKAKLILKQFQKGNFYFEESEKEEKPKHDGPILPKEFQKIKRGKEPLSIIRYFEKRNFPLKYIQKYKTGYCRTGKYAFSMVVPIFYNKKIVSWIAVDLIHSKGYQICPNHVALIEKRELAYGLDDIIGAREIYIVEGYTDRWRMGSKALALLTNQVSTNVLLKIKKRIHNDCRVKILLDIDAKRNAEQLSNNIKSILYENEVIFIELEKQDNAKDPDQLTKKQIRYIKNL